MKVFITSSLVRSAGIELLHTNGFTIAQNTSPKPLSYPELLESLSTADAVISSIGDTIDKALLDQSPQVKIIANFGVGFNNIDWQYARTKNIFITNTPDTLTEATADTAFLLLLAVARRYRESEQLLRQTDKFIGWATLQNLGIDLAGKTLGIVGFGKIGSAVAERAKAFGMNIIFTAQTQKESQLGKQVSFQTLLTESNIISIHAPLTDTTKHLFTKKEFDQLKPNAILINTARGAIIKESDLVLALQEGKFFGVGLDVYEYEPKITAELLSFDNVVLLPHIGGATIETRDRMSIRCAENVIAALAGKQPRDVVWK
jgi:glyoxylate reductase